jgi:hypothetical protein
VYRRRQVPDDAETRHFQFGSMKIFVRADAGVSFAGRDKRRAGR